MNTVERPCRPECDRCSSMQLLQQFPRMTFLMKYGEQWFRRQNVRKNLGSRVMRRLGSNDHQRIRIQQDLNCLQVRDSSRLLLDDILKTKLARIGQNLVHAVSVGGISGA